jgi:hypothetical protein
VLIELSSLTQIVPTGGHGTLAQAYGIVLLEVRSVKTAIDYRAVWRFMGIGMAPAGVRRKRQFASRAIITRTDGPHHWNKAWSV